MWTQVILIYNLGLYIVEPRRIPLIKILKGRLLKIAELQDAVILELSRRFNFVLHGGLAVWRVYGGKRFSLDIDIYHDNPREVNIPFKSTRVLTASGVLYLRIKDDVEIELEASPMFEEGSGGRLLARRWE
jgi:hypothetical protein